MFILIIVFRSKKLNVVKVILDVVKLIIYFVINIIVTNKIIIDNNTNKFIKS